MKNILILILFPLADVPKGTYQWAVAIVDQTKNQQPGIKLAVRDREKKNDWILLNDIIIQ